MRAWAWTAVVLVAACGPSDDWRVVGEGIDEGLLSVTGTAADDVWTVGGDVGSGPAVLHYDGADWSRVDVGGSGDLWWAWPSSEGVWMVGAGGRARLHDPATGEGVEHTVEEGVVLFGVWGAAADDVWTVGADADFAADGARMFHWDGAAWTAVELPEALASLVAIYKVWGTASDDVWVVGTDGASAHWDGTAWTPVDTGTTRTLFTIHGSGPDDVYAVGGFGTGTVVHWDGTAWSDVSPAGAGTLNGVCSAGGVTHAVGATGGTWAREAGEWIQEGADDGPLTLHDLHATWVDPDGGTWAVGGAIASAPLEQGVVLYQGAGEPGVIP